MNLETINWEQDYQLFKKYLFGLKDSQYATFHSKLIRILTHQLLALERLF